MHIFLATRGIKQNVDYWTMMMQLSMYPWQRTNLETGKKEVSMVQGALRPIQLWEYIIPKESLAEVLTAMQKTKGDQKAYFGKGLAKYSLPTLRKILGANPIPEIDAVKTDRILHMPGVGIELIGVKDDETNETFGYNQEGL